MPTTNFQKFFDRIFKLLMINFTYFFAIIIGLGLAGLFPASVALFKTIPHFNELDYKALFIKYLQAYKHNFIKANVGGYLLSLIAVGAYFNYYLLSHSHSILLNSVSIIVLLGTIYLALALTNTIMTTSLSNMTLKNRFIKSCLYTFVNLGHSILQLVVVGIYLTVVAYAPVTFLFGGTTLMAYLFYQIYSNGLNKINQLKIKQII